MQRLLPLLMAVAALALPAGAAAKGCTRTLTPPGNSAVNQYVETVPTAGGGCPTSRIHSSGGPPGGKKTGALPSRTASALAARGPVGAADLSFARATAPAHARKRKTRRVAAGHNRSQPPSSASTPPASGGGGDPAVAVVKALTGSGGGGLGVLLPIILAAAVLAAAGIVLTRRRDTA